MAPKYLACVETDEETGEVIVHVLNEAKTKELNEGADYVKHLLDEEIETARKVRVVADLAAKHPG